MKNEINGVVMEIQKDYCIIMTREGEFRRVAKPPGRIEVGQEVAVRTNTLSGWLRPLALAASLFLMVAGWSVYQWNLPTAVAYVSIDINPSIELGVDLQSQVVEAEGLNEDGQKLLKTTPVKGKDVYAAMSDLIAAAVQQQFINEQKENTVFTTIELERDAPVSVLEEKQVYQAINSSLQLVKMPVNVQVAEAKPEERKEAHKLGVSTGRYLLIIDEVKENKDIQAKDLVKKNLNDLKVKQWIQKNQQKKDSSWDEKIDQGKDQDTVLDTDQVKDEDKSDNRLWRNLKVRWEQRYQQIQREKQEKNDQKQDQDEQEDSDKKDDKAKPDKPSKLINNAQSEENSKGIESRNQGRNNYDSDHDDH